MAKYCKCIAKSTGQQCRNLRVGDTKKCAVHANTKCGEIKKSSKKKQKSLVVLRKISKEIEFDDISNSELSCKKATVKLIEYLDKNYSTLIADLDVENKKIAYKDVNYFFPTSVIYKKDPYKTATCADSFISDLVNDEGYSLMLKALAKIVADSAMSSVVPSSHYNTLERFVEMLIGHDVPLFVTRIMVDIISDKKIPLKRFTEKSRAHFISEILNLEKLISGIPGVK